VPEVKLGTAVVPIQPRHPLMLAAQALAVQSATSDRLILGIGLSHQMVIENVFGQEWNRPARYMREYLEILVPALRGEQVTFQGEVLRASTFGPLETPGAASPPVLVAALGPEMLGIAARLSSGTVTWMTGASTVADHIAPTINEQARLAGMPKPEVVVHLPACVTNDPDGAREHAAKLFAVYGHLPSYRAMLDREGVEGPADLAIVGDESQVSAEIQKVEDAGATQFSAAVFGNAEERRRTIDLIATLAKG
jgi:F420-dependent oxidoreductase-like protein